MERLEKAINVRNPQIKERSFAMKERPQPKQVKNNEAKEATGGKRCRRGTCQRSASRRACSGRPWYPAAALAALAALGRRAGAAVAGALSCGPSLGFSLLRRRRSQTARKKDRQTDRQTHLLISLSLYLSETDRPTFNKAY